MIATTPRPVSEGPVLVSFIPDSFKVASRRQAREKQG
jgi:hypothetical protein